eukprot:3428180-Amphidinium_carterae.1
MSERTWNYDNSDNSPRPEVFPSRNGVLFVQTCNRVSSTNNVAGKTATEQSGSQSMTTGTATSTYGNRSGRVVCCLFNTGSHICHSRVGAQYV